MSEEKYRSLPMSLNAIDVTSFALARSDGQGLEKLPQIGNTRSGTAEKT